MKTDGRMKNDVDDVSSKEDSSDKLCSGEKSKNEAVSLREKFNKGAPEDGVASHRLTLKL